MRIALHESIALAAGDAADVIVACADKAGFADVEIVPFSSAIDLVDEMVPARGHILDLIITPFSPPGACIMKTLEEIRVELPLIYTIVFDKGIEHAAEASLALVDGYLLEPVSVERFEEELRRVFDSMKRLHAASFIVNSAVGERRIPYHSVFYAETSGHDQVLALEDGRSLNVRCSSQALFDLLSEDGRFFKAGSSYIVNLNEVVELHVPSGTLTLSNGTKLTVPFRVRKPLESTLLEWC